MMNAIWVLLGCTMSAFVCAQLGDRAFSLTLHDPIFFLVGLFLSVGVFYKQYFVRRKNPRRGDIYHDVSDGQLWLGGENNKSVQLERIGWVSSRRVVGKVIVSICASQPSFHAIDGNSDAK